MNPNDYPDPKLNLKSSSNSLQTTGQVRASNLPDAKISALYAALIDVIEDKKIIQTPGGTSLPVSKETKRVLERALQHLESSLDACEKAIAMHDAETHIYGQ